MFVLILMSFMTASVCEPRSCDDYCAALISGQSTSTWKFFCNCHPQSSNELYRRRRSLDNNPIYYEPLESYPLPDLSFVDEPFVILNPTMNHKEKYSKLPQLEPEHHKKYKRKDDVIQNDNINNNTERLPLYLDMDVKRSPGQGRSSQNNSEFDNLQLSEKDLKDCVDLHLLLYFRQHRSNDIEQIWNEPNIKNYINISDVDLRNELDRKCNLPSRIVEESLRQIEKSSSSNTDNSDSKQTHNIFSSDDDLSVSSSSVIPKIIKVTGTNNRNEDMSTVTVFKDIPKTLSTIMPKLTNNFNNSETILGPYVKTKSEKVQNDLYNKTNENRKEFSTSTPITNSLMDYSQDWHNNSTESFNNIEISINGNVDSMTHTPSTINTGSLETPLESNLISDNNTDQIVSKRDSINIETQSKASRDKSKDQEESSNNFQYTTIRVNNIHKFNINEITHNQVTLNKSTTADAEDLTTATENNYFIQDVNNGLVAITDRNMVYTTNYSVNGQSIPENKTLVPSIVATGKSNNTIISSLDGVESDLNNDFLIHSKIYLSGINNGDVKGVSEESEVSGNLYFMFKKQLIPLRFVQTPEGTLNLAIDGTSFCKNLVNAEGPNTMLSVLCNFAVYNNSKGPK